MSVLRSRLVWLAAITLTVQVAGLAIAPAALCCTPGDPAGQAMDCCKDAGPGHVCLLMKKQAAPAGDDHSGPVLRACCSPDDQIFAALLGLLAVVPPVPAGLADQPRVAFVPLTGSAHLPGWLGAVQSPPPRA